MKKLFILFFILVSCSKDQFATRPTTSGTSVDPVVRQEKNTHSNFTLFKPPVDFLFVWDNTGTQSSDFMNPTVRSEVNKVVQYISQDFDYRILFAPLIGSGLENAHLVIDNPDNLPSDLVGLKEFIVPYQQASTILESYLPEKNVQSEMGLERINELTNLGHKKNIFRNSSYLVVVIMSNGDDLGFNKSGTHKTAEAVETYYKAQKDKLMELKNTCQHRDLRVFSLVRHSKCTRGYAEPNYFYKRLSKDMFNSSSTPSSSDYGSDSPDSYDLCQEGEKRIFSGINGTIKAITVKNVYRYWPVARSSDPPFDSERLRVFKNDKEIFEKGPGDSDGFLYLDGVQTKNLREYPTIGDSFTGHIIELFGNSKVVYPDTMKIVTQAPLVYYGYVRLDTEPLVDSIKLFINSRQIPRRVNGSGSGWEFIPGFKTSWNVRIQGPNNDRPGLPAENKTGFFLKLYGDAVFSNNDAASIKIDYQPAAK
jgi:hypothetical protein